jgi:tRNA (guanosine-2'-O-)-methyltransferase
LNSRFPFQNEIKFPSGFATRAELIEKHIWPLLTPERQEKIKRVAAKRCFSLVVVMESIYDRGNISAVMRTGEGLGFANFHIVETFEKFKEANRVTQGADKWVEVQKWKSTTDCIKNLKENNYQICVTALAADSVPISDVDFSIPTALVLGNEKQGVSAEMIAAADKKIIIPMPGFVQSFNISVAGALSLYHIMQDRIRRLGKNQDLSESEIQILKMVYALNTLDSSEDILKAKAAAQQL